MNTPAGITDDNYIFSICPHTGASVVTRKDWKNVLFGDAYCLSIAIIENCIISVKVEGYSTLDMVTISTDFTRNVILEYFGKDKAIYYIGDFVGVEGITKEAREYYLKYIKSIPNIKGFILSSPTPFLIFIARLSKRFNLTSIDVYVEKNYTDALKSALELSRKNITFKASSTLYKQKITFSPVTPNIPSKWASLRKFSPFKRLWKKSQKQISLTRLTRKNWTVNYNGYSAYFEIIGGDIIHKTAKGPITLSCLIQTFDIQQNIAKECSLKGTPFYCINGVEDIYNVSLKVRKKYAHLLSDWLDEFEYPNVIIMYGASRLLKAGLSVSTFNKPVTILFANDLQEALSLVQLHKENKNLSLFHRPIQKRYRYGTVNFYAEELNRFLSNIDWEVEGNNSLFPEKEKSHPFKAVYDAMALIKSDIEELFNNREMAQFQIRELTQELIKAQEKERRRIARDLHDNVAQDLASLIITSDTIFDSKIDIPSSIKEKTKTVSHILRKTIGSIRDLVYDLRPPGLTQMGVVKTMAQYCQDFSQKNHIEIDFYTAGLEKVKLDIDTKINLFRILQEALNNVKKHANASLIKVRLIASYPKLILRIEDNGCGFDPEIRMVTALQEKRMGLKSMEERVKLLDGNLSIRSRLQAGTKIIVKFPCHPFLQKENDSKQRLSKDF